MFGSVARTFFLEITDVRPKKNEKNGGKSPKKRRKNEFQPQISQILTLPTFFIAFLCMNFLKNPIFFIKFLKKLVDILEKKLFSKLWEG